MADHQFVPTAYHTTLGPHDPVLTIEPGDRVATTTVDAAGCDAAGRAVTPAGNPQTGPFRVAGAEPGDTLAVNLETIRPNRDRGYTRTWVAPNVLDPGSPTLPADLPARIEWQVDREHGVAAPLGVPGLEHWRLPLAPMIGCFGVAPERRQAISTATSDRHGGNMDWNGFRAGVTALFPVFEPGALFCLGDVHAVQGDGRRSSAPASKSPPTWCFASSCTRIAASAGRGRGRRPSSPPWATRGPSTNACSTPPRRCCAGWRRITASTATSRTLSSARPSATNSATCSTPRIRWCAPSPKTFSVPLHRGADRRLPHVGSAVVL